MNGKRINPMKILKFKLIFWRLVVFVFLCMCVLMALGSVLSDYLQTRFLLTGIQAANSIVFHLFS